ncbi:MAG: hypothetical protein RL272_1141 [Candidatus Parcubacteria bacterium]|jgi:hypothetical protein
MSAKNSTHRHGDRPRPIAAQSPGLGPGHASLLAALRERRSFLRSEIGALLRLGMQIPEGAKHARGLTAADRELLMQHQREISGIDATLRRFA